MKLKTFFLLSILLCLVSACSSQDDSGLAIPKETAINYLPLTIGNQWTYISQVTLDSVVESDTTEVISVSGVTEDNETPGYLFSSSVAGDKQGLTAMLWTSGMLNKVEGRIIYNGNFIFKLPFSGDSLVIPLHNLIYVNQNADNNQELSSFSGNLQDSISLDSTQYPIHYRYQLTSIENQAYTSYSNGLNTYEDLISSSLNLELSASITLPNGNEVELISNQDVLKTTNFYAREIGMVHSLTDIKIIFEDLSAYDLPALPTSRGTATETLTTYEIN